MDLFNLFPQTKSFRYVPLHGYADPEIVFSHLSQTDYSALLCGRGNTDNARFAYIGIHPFLRLRQRANEAVISIENEEVPFSIDPFQLFGEAVKFYSVEAQPFPISLWGAIGCFSYDAAAARYPASPGLRR